MKERYNYHTVKKPYLLTDNELNNHSIQGWHLLACTSAKLRSSDCLTGDSDCRTYMIYIFRSNNKGVSDETKHAEE